MQTDQEFYDKTISHLRKQGQRSLSPEGSSCRYRGEKGLMCAIGCHIPDEIYTPRMEGYPVRALVSLFREVNKYLCPNVILMSDLQRLHDRQMVVGYEIPFETVAQNIAISHGLIYTPPQ